MRHTTLAVAETCVWPGLIVLRRVYLPSPSRMGLVGNRTTRYLIFRRRAVGKHLWLEQRRQSGKRCAACLCSSLRNTPTGRRPKQHACRFPLCLRSTTCHTYFDQSIATRKTRRNEAYPPKPTPAIITEVCALSLAHAVYVWGHEARYSFAPGSQTQVTLSSVQEGRHTSSKDT